MKKAFVFCLLIGIAAFGFASGSSQTSGAAQGAANAPVTIELWYGSSVTEAGPPPADWKVLQLIKDRLNIDLRISALPSGPGDQDVKINAAAAGNSLPDMFQVSRDVLRNLVRIGVAAPVDDLFPQMPHRTSIMYDADAISYVTFNGKAYGFPSPGAIIKNEGLLIRKDWLDKLGLSVPVTSDELFAVMKAFTENDPDGNGRADTYGFGAFLELTASSFEDGLGRRFDPLFGAFGVAGTWDLTKASAGLNIHKPEYYDALAYVKRMVDEKVIDPNWISYNKDDFRAAWKQGRFGIMREQNAAYAAESNYTPFDKNFPNGQWLVIDPPKGPTGKQSTGVYTQSYRIYSVSTKAIQAGKGPAIAKLLEWMSSDEGYYLLGWGEKGVNYNLGPDGSPTVDGLPDPSKGYTRPEMQPLTQLRNIVYYNGEIELLSRYPTYKAPTSGKTMSALTVLQDMQSRPWTPNIGGDTLPPAGNDLQRFLQQGVVEFVLGQRPLTPDTWKTWVANFDSMGGLAWEKAGIEAAEAAGYIQ